MDSAAKKDGAVGGQRNRRGYAHPLILELPQVVHTWERLRDRLVSAVRKREADLRRADRQLRAARGGMSRRRWEQIVEGRSRVRTARDSQAVFRSIRLRPAADAAEAHLAEVEASTRVAIDEGWAGLRDATRDVLRYGPVAATLCGVPLSTLTRIAAVPDQEASVLRPILRSSAQSDPPAGAPSSGSGALGATGRAAPGGPKPGIATGHTINVPTRRTKNVNQGPDQGQGEVVPGRAR